MAAPLPRSLVVGYGLGSLGTGLYSTVPNLFLLIYLTDLLGVSPALAGVAILFPRIWDIVSDPLMGQISDRSRSPWGRRRPFLLVGGLTLPVCLGLLFSAPDLAGSGAFFYTVAIYIACATAFTVFQVPYIAMPAEMTDDYHGTTRLMAYRMAFMTAGILIAGGVAPLLMAAAGGGRAGYAAMSWALAGLCLLGMLGCFFGTRGARFTAADPTSPGFGVQLRAALSNRPFVALTTAYILQLAAVGCLVTTVAYYAKYVIGGGEATVTVLFLALMLPAIVTMPLWLALSRRLGKERCYQLALVLFAAGAFALRFVGSGLGVAAAVIAVMGVAYAASQLFPFAMLPDTIACDREASGAHREGIFTGLWTAVDKGGLALGGFLAAELLGVYGFVEGQGDAVITQPPEALEGIVLAMSWVPAVLTLACAALFRRYPAALRASGYRGDRGGENSPIAAEEEVEEVEEKKEK